MEETIEGIVESQVFYNESNHYGVYRINLSNINDRPLTIVGNLYNLEVDTFYEFKGSYVENQRFGLQFQVTSFRKLLPVKREYVIRYLSGPSFPGIGVKSAQLIVEHYGEGVLEQLRQTPDMELDVPSIGKEKLELLRDTILKQNPMDEIVSFLNTHGVSGKQINQIIVVYGDRTKEIVEENPYRMLDEVSGVGFRTCDKLAYALGFSNDHPYRVEGLMVDAVRRLSFEPGHSFIYIQDLMKELSFLTSEIFDETFQALIKKRQIVEDEGRIYHYTQFDAETEVASFLSEFQYLGDDFYIDDLNQAIEKVEKRLNIEYDKDQKQVMVDFFNHDVMLLTGGPGTGKSTLLSGIVTLLQTYCPQLHITLCAPTGRAAKRLEALTQVSATTIHSCLKWNLETNVFGANEQNPLETDVIIVDEFSMVDIWLLHNLLKASSNVKKFLFVGDKNQLPSVGPGFVLGDIIASNSYSVSTLSRNYRQEAGSEVIDLALHVNQGQFDVSKYHRDVRYFDSRYGQVKDIVLKVVLEALNKGYTIHDIQVLAPVYAGPSGIDNLNYFLQKACNPESSYKRTYQSGSRVFREGDKILQLKNQPDDGVYNGDIGTLIEIDERNHVIVDFDGIFVEYEPSNLINITHAYAMSVHKAQGSEYPIVIIIADKRFSSMLSRRLYYTAITRSSKSLVLIGDLEAFEVAALNGYEERRNTYLKERLKK